MAGKLYRVEWTGLAANGWQRVVMHANQYANNARQAVTLMKKKQSPKMKPQGFKATLKR